MKEKQNKYLKFDLRGEEDEKQMGTIYRERELNTLKKMAQDREQYRK